jgi:hypothetical protein
MLTLIGNSLACFGLTPLRLGHLWIDGRSKNTELRLKLPKNILFFLAALAIFHSRGFFPSIRDLLLPIVVAIPRIE